MADTLPVDGTPERAAFALKLGGAEVEPSVRLDVLEVDVSEEVGKHARATLLVRNWDVDTREVRYSDGDEFAPGTDVEVSLGWQSELVPVFAGVVTGVTGHFGADSGPTLEVSCRSRSVLLAAAPRSRVYEDVTDGDVAGDLASRYGLTAAADDGVRQPLVTWQRTTDWDWLVARAARLGWVVYVRDKDLVLRPPAEPGSEDVALKYGTALREVHVTRELDERVDPVEVAVWSPDDLEAVTAEAGSGRAEPPSGDRPTPAADIEESGWPLRAAAVATPAGIGSAEADRIAVGAASEQVLRHVSGTGRTIGVPRLRCDSWLQIDGVGGRLGGKHYVSAVRHRLGRQGFTTEFQLGRPAPLRPAADPDGAPGLLLGVVADLDDELQQGRVKVRFPWLTGAEPVWARLSVLDAGPEQGTWFVPDVGQEVLVGHVGADQRFPVVLGALWNGRQKPPEQMDAASNAIRSIVTRSGHRLTFDDADPGSVTVTTAAGHTVKLDDAAGEISLAEKDGKATLTVGGNGIALEATQGDVTIKAPAGKVVVEATGFEATSTGPAKVESRATLDLKAAATLNASGAMVRIN